MSESPHTPGSTKLTPEQSDYYLNKFGVRYTHVQDQPFTRIALADGSPDGLRPIQHVIAASRAERRRNRFRPRMGR